MKMILTDLDGTLLAATENQISARTSAMLSEVCRKGIHFAVASGRAISELWRLFAPFREKLLFAACDGALIFEGEKLIYEAPIQDILQFDRAETVLLQGKYITYMKGQTEFVRSMKLHYGGHAVEICSTDEIEEPIYKAVVYGARPAVQGVCCVYETPQYAEYNAVGADKGSAVAFLLERYGVQRAEAMAFGDNTNDLPMLRAVEHSYAVRNARLAVQNACKYTTDDPVNTIVQYINK